MCIRDSYCLGDADAADEVAAVQDALLLRLRTPSVDATSAQEMPMANAGLADEIADELLGNLRRSSVEMV